MFSCFLFGFDKALPLVAEFFVHSAEYVKIKWTRFNYREWEAPSGKPKFL
jgi:hypothetical protein